MTDPDCRQVFESLRVRGGPLPGFADPGRQPLAYVAADGGRLCPACANREHDSQATIDPAEALWDGQRLLVGCEVAAPGRACSHCGAPIGPGEPAESA